jgi:hypothetical protein
MRMRKLTLLVACAAMSVALGSASSWAVTVGNSWYVDPENGTDQAGCGGESIANGVTNEPVGTNPPTTGPCQTLNQALANAASGDNIFIEKGGIFGPIYITGAIAINGPADNSAVIQWVAGTQPGCIGGAVGSCNGNANATYAVDVQAGSSNTVKIKNVIISNAGGSTGAIHIGNNFGVSFKQVAVRGGGGTIPEMININPTALNSSGGPVQVYFANCDIGFSPSGGGVYIAPTASVNVLFQGGEVHSSNFGIKADATAGPLPSGSSIQVATDATEFFSHSTGAVIAKTSPTLGATGGVHFVLSRSTILGTGSYAAYANGANASMILYEDTISGNFVGVGVSNSGTVISMANNEIFGNTTQCEVSGAASACDGGALSVQALQ